MSLTLYLNPAFLFPLPSFLKLFPSDRKLRQTHETCGDAVIPVANLIFL